MNNKTLRLSVLFGVIQIVLTGCSITTIGEPDFSCAGRPSGSLCKGPMEIYELTNTHDNLEHLMLSPEEKEELANNQENAGTANSPQSHYQNPDEVNTNYIYKPLTEARQYPDSYEKAVVTGVAVPQMNGAEQPTSYSDKPEINRLREYGHVPYDMAPEPLAVLEEAEAMRIYVSSWEDKSGDLNMPGYVYVELKPKRWIAGRQANLRPSRIVPFQMISKGTMNVKRKKQFNKGVDALNIERPLSDPRK